MITTELINVKNLLWRIDLARQAQPHTQDNCYRFAGYCLNVSRHTLERDGEPKMCIRDRAFMPHPATAP